MVAVEEVSPRDYDRSSFHQSFRFKGLIGTGAFAQVYSAQHEHSSTEVAVKVTDLRSEPHGASRTVDARKLQSAQREVAALQKVGVHRNCVRLCANFVDDTVFYVVMEKCDRSLLHALERLPDVKELNLRNMFSQMLQALSHIHSLGLVHRDIKPDNFLCCGNAHVIVKLCDFGLAETLKSTGDSELRGVYGTAPFMSPEMLGTQGYGTSTDVWSFGVIAYVLLLGSFPYQPVDRTAKAMKEAIETGLPKPSFTPAVDTDVAGNKPITDFASDFLQFVLLRDPAERPSAGNALKHSWFTCAPLYRLKKKYPSLRPMLYAAKRNGAFDTRMVQTDLKTSMEERLMQLQAIYHSLNTNSAHSISTSGRVSPSSSRRVSTRLAAEEPEKEKVDTSTTEHTSASSTDTGMSI